MLAFSGRVRNTLGAAFFSSTITKMSHKEMNKVREETWWKKNFPNVQARAAADQAIDELDVGEPMSRFIDTWIEVS
jgi:hypothetical protein